jgi:4-hydroxy-2-oxoheptanedioate aldolase
MSIRENRVVQTLRSGGTVLSSSVRLPEAGLCEILGYAGFDFVLLDCEHGAVDPSTLDRMVQSCFAGGTVPVVRMLRPRDPEAVMLALDLGAQGILIPHCRTADDARALRQAALYPPVGNRGFGPGRGTRWGRVPTAEYFRGINDTIFLFALIEDPEAIDQIDEIAGAGLDCLWVGTGDLALADGVPGERKHPRVMQAAQKVLDACKRHNIAAGWPASDADDAKWAMAQGYRAIGYGGAESYIMQQSRQFLGALGRT